MKKYTIEFSRRAAKVFDSLVRSNRNLGQRLVNAIDELATDALLGVPLAGRLKGLYKLRVGDYRIVYGINKSRLIIYIFDISHRREIYRK